MKATAKKKHGGIFVANDDGTFYCSDCIPDDVDVSLDEVEVWEEGSHGWVGQPICRVCQLSIPVYVDGTEDGTPEPGPELDDCMACNESIDPSHRVTAHGHGFCSLECADTPREDWVGLLMVECAACGKEVREVLSWGDGEVGDHDFPSFCSETCRDKGPRDDTEFDVDDGRRRDPGREDFHSDG